MKSERKGLMKVVDAWTTAMIQMNGLRLGLRDSKINEMEVDIRKSYNSKRTRDAHSLLNETPGRSVRGRRISIFRMFYSVGWHPGLLSPCQSICVGRIIDIGRPIRSRVQQPRLPTRRETETAIRDWPTSAADSAAPEEAREDRRAVVFDGHSCLVGAPGTSSRS
jgi:hypothetical protein